METFAKYPGYKGIIKKALGKIKIINRQTRIKLLNQKNKIMAKEMFIHPTQIPVEPHIYSLLSQGFCDENLKMCMFKAVSEYNKKCEEAYEQLLLELKECLGESYSDKK